MSSSTGNTIDPQEALQLVPPEILRYLIASTKPKKAITFDPGMSLVELADEYERQVARDLDSEMKNSELSRRQKVAIEDAEGALRMSKISDQSSSSVSFRHLALLAQVKSDNEIIETIGTENIGKLERMKNWINGPYFPEQLKITIAEQPISGLDKSISNSLHRVFSKCNWDIDGITEAIKSAIKDDQIPPRDCYRTLYTAIIGKEKGPKSHP